MRCFIWINGLSESFRVFLSFESTFKRIKIIAKIKPFLSPAERQENKLKDILILGLSDGTLFECDATITLFQNFMT